MNLKYLKFDRGLIFGLILVAPFIVFIITNPFMLSDFYFFLKQTGFEVLHYKVLGHGESATSVPGVKHFIFQMTLIKNNLPTFLFYLAFIGIFMGLRKWNSLIIMLVFPLVYTYYMVQQKVNYHRNFICIYPFFAIFSAIAITFISKRLHQLGLFLRKKSFNKIKKLEIIFSSLPFVATISLLFGSYLKEFKIALQLWRTPETRTQAIEYINSIVDTTDKNIIIGIAKELRLHRLDLRKLKANYEIFEHKDITQNLKKYDYLLVGEYLSVDKELHKEDEQLNKLTPQNLIHHIIEGKKAWRDLRLINPKVIILKGLK